MKKYVKPTLTGVEFKIEERLASDCTGSCGPDDFSVKMGWLVYQTYSV